MLTVHQFLHQEFSAFLIQKAYQSYVQIFNFLAANTIGQHLEIWNRRPDRRSITGSSPQTRSLSTRLDCPMGCPQPLQGEHPRDDWPDFHSYLVSVGSEFIRLQSWDSKISRRTLGLTSGTPSVPLSCPILRISVHSTSMSKWLEEFQSYCVLNVYILVIVKGKVNPLIH
jgi:hypothetical protein